MKKKCLVLASVLFLGLTGVVFGTTVASAQPGKIKPAPSHPIQGQYVVVLKASSADVKARSFETKGAKTLFKYDAALNGLAVKATPEQIAKIASDPDVDAVYPDGEVAADTAASDVGTQPVVTNETPEAAPAVTGCQFVPNPPNSFWGLDRVDEHFFPLDNRYCWPFAGTAVRAYVIDTGIQTSHPQFGGRALAVADFIGDGRNGQDCNGHGTHVAGTIGGATFGLAKGAKLRAVRVLNCAGSGSFSAVIAGVNFVTAHSIKPAVANMSLGGGFFAPLNQAVTNSINSGVQYAIAAGNSNHDACLDSPGSAPGTITAASTGNRFIPADPRTDRRSDFSNFGPCVDIFAPGALIKSAFLNSGTAVLSGTSMASPHVAGVMVLLLARTPTLTPAQVRSQLITDSTKNVVSDPRGTVNRLAFVRR